MFSFHRKTTKKAFLDAFIIGLAAILAGAVVFCPGSALAAAAKQKQFGSPEEAVKSLITAIKANDTSELLAIFGPAGKVLISSGDEVADQAGRERFAKAFEEMNQLEKKDENRVILHVGSEDWPFPVPIVKQSDSWYFATSEGKDEILNRRIGKNELNAMQVCLAIVDAEVEYAAKDRDGDGIREYAQKLVSTEGHKDGLYWDAKEGEEPSPLGPLAAKAGREGYAGKQRSGSPVPYHGYFLPDLERAGDERFGWSPQLPGQGSPDRRFCPGCLSCRIRQLGHHDFYREPRWGGLRKGPGQEHSQHRPSHEGV